MAKKLKVAIVHDWLVGGGAERVVEALHRMYPDAPIYTSYCTPDWQKRLDGKVVTGFLQRWPFSKLRKFVAPLRIWWFTHLDFSGYNLVISSSGNGEAKGIRVPEGTTHVCYCHSPTHFYWRHYNLYIKNPGFGMLNPVARLGLRLLVGPLRKWDLKASQRPDYYIANSSHIQADIKKYYGRDAVVINPPVDVERFAVAQPAKRDTFVIAGRQVPQKKFDLVVAACSKASLPLLVLGKGPEHKKLVAMAGPTVNFVEEVSDSEMPGLIAGTNAFIFPCFDDFGIIPVEAMATGTPVIAFKAGGALDYVIPGKTGEFFDEQTIPAVRKALRNFDPKHYRPAVIQEHAAGFSAQVFRDKMQHFIDTVLR